MNGVLVLSFAKEQFSPLTDVAGHNLDVVPIVGTRHLFNTFNRPELVNDAINALAVAHTHSRGDHGARLAVALRRSTNAWE